jgi:hypothetical protein
MRSWLVSVASADQCSEPFSPPVAGEVAQYISLCKRCGQQIAWDRTKNGKNVPIDPDGRIHFGTCPMKRQKQRESDDGSGHGIPG